MNSKTVWLIGYRRWDEEGFLPDEIHYVTVEGFGRQRAAVAFFKETHQDVEIQSARNIICISPQ